MFKPQQQQQQQQQSSQLPAVVQQMRVLQQQQQQQQLVQQQDRQHSNSSSSEQHLPPLRAVPVAGAIAGVALSVILAPTELIKCRMQVRLFAGWESKYLSACVVTVGSFPQPAALPRQRSRDMFHASGDDPDSPVAAAAAVPACIPQMAQFNSPLLCLANVVETEGLRGLTRGFLPTLCREIPGNALFFTVYEGLRRSWPGRPSGHGSSSSSSSSSSGGLAAAWQVVVDAGSAIVCGGMAGVVVSGMNVGGSCLFAVA
jgi:hypothetical protein